MKLLGSSLLSIGVCAAVAQLPTVQHVKRLDLSTDFFVGGSLGDDACDVTWDGASLFVAGFRTQSGPGQVGLLKIFDPLGFPSKSVFSTVFAAGNNRDSKVVCHQNNLFHGFGLGDFSNTNVSGIRKIQLSGAPDGSFSPGTSPGVLYPIEALGAANDRIEAFDFDPITGNLALVSRNKSLVYLFNAAGAAAGTLAMGAVPATMLWRDIVFTPTGHAYMREANDINSGARSGASLNPILNLVELTSSDLPQQSVVYHPGGTGFGPFLWFNDRNPTADRVIYITDLSGGPTDHVTGRPTTRVTGAEPINGVPQTAWGSQVMGSCAFSIGGNQYIAVVQGGAADKLSIYKLVASSTTVSGNLYIGPYSPAKLATTPFRIQLRTTGGAFVEEHEVFIDSDGRFEFGTTQSGTFDVWARGRSWLGALDEDVVIASGGVSGIGINLYNGDIDRDNVITLIDYDVFSTYFDKTASDSDWGTVGPNGFAPRDADLDGDDSVSLIDYDVFSENFDRQGVD